MKMKLFVLLGCLLLFKFTSQSQIIENSFHVKLNKSYDYKFLLYQPLQVDSSRKPLIVFLHGAGERGTNTELLKIHGPLKYIQSQQLDAYILAPQCPLNLNWESESLYKLIQMIVKKHPVDSTRIYLTGLSMGAWGSWNLALAHPEAFAALIPIAGFVDRMVLLNACELRDISIHIFHGANDDVVNVSYSEEIYERLLPCTKDLIITITENAGHDCWTPVYDSPEIYKWMFSKSKKLK